MATLSVYGADLSVTRKKAVEDAKKMQALVEDKCAKNGLQVPRYNLTELIGKGSFGRVYKGTGQETGQIVAIKIIDIEESDLEAPKFATTMDDLAKEIKALQRLSEGGAKNINVIVDAFNIGHSMWMITEHCAGGSVATLMKPTAPGGLQERWIIPILREVAEAVYWVHKEGIVHRDIKCANVLVTEAGGIQLCDFGVAGFVDTRADKRTTFIGTLHWMAPEMFDRDAKYATEVDIWAFGSMAFEAASGLPPNVAQGVMNPAQMGSWLRTHKPRLEGDQYSLQLKNIVQYCLELDPLKRPVIQQVQDHPYLRNTEGKFPTSSLAQLVKAYRLWEAQGGSRKSLFAPGGAQGPSQDNELPTIDEDEWNFSTTAAFDEAALNTDIQAMYDAYGSNVLSEDTAKPQKPKSRRRMPTHLKSAPQQKAPIEKLFDPNTIANYDDYSRDYYSREMPMPEIQVPDPPPPQRSDLPLRDPANDATVRESLIDLDASLHDNHPAPFVDMATIKPAPPNADEDNDYAKPPLSDPADLNNNRRTQDWKFPPMAPLSANPGMSRFPFNEATPSSSARPPPLLHHPTEPAALLSQEQSGPRPAENRDSVSSLIDLDEGLVDIPRPPTANSDAGSVSGSEVGANPFEFERHPSLYAPLTSIPGAPIGPREPSIYVSDDSEYAQNLPTQNQDMVDLDEATAGLGLDDGSRTMETQRKVHNYSTDSSASYYGSAITNGGPPGYGSDTEFPGIESSLPLPPDQLSRCLSSSGGAPASLPGAIPVPEGMLFPPAMPTQPPADVMLGHASNEKVMASLGQSIEELRHNLIFASHQMAEAYHAQRTSAAGGNSGQEQGVNGKVEEEVGD